MSQFLFASGCVVRSLAGPGANVATLTGEAVDIRDLEGPVLVTQASGAGTGTTPTLDGKLQHSLDGSTSWADIAGATFAQVLEEASLQKFALNPNGTRGYIRYVGTIAGETPSFDVTVLIAGMKRYG